jgi:small subunit ribosomal protein S4
MSKREESKYKINRRLGVNLWGRAKSPLNRREYGPGQHGQRRKKPSDYGTQLSAKQKLKGYYANIGERQFRRLYEEAVRRRGDTGENLIELLERRLDAAVYRMKLAPTPFAARQLVNHGHVLVNGRRLNIPSYQLRDGDTIELKQHAKEMALVIEASRSSERDVPDYIEIDHDRMRGSFVRAPKLADVPYPVTMEPNLVVEYYSR